MEDDLREIRTRISTANAKKARAHAEHDAAVARRDLAVQTLQDDFGVSTKEEISAKLEELRSDLATQTARIEEELEAAGA